MDRSYMQMPTGLSQAAYPPPHTNFPHFSQAQSQSITDNVFDDASSTGKEKLQVVLCEIVQMYALQFKIVDNLLGILKSELQKF